MSDAVSARNVRRCDVLSRFCLSPSGLHKNLKLRRFPQPFFVGGKPLWREADLAAVEAGIWKPEVPEGVEPPSAPASTAAAPRKLGRPRGAKNRPKAA